MAISSKLLNEGERVVVTTRTHGKALLLPALCLILVAAVAGFASSFPSGESAARVIAVIWGLALVVVLWLVVLPFLRWLTSTYTLTDRRLVTRTGILTRRGHDIPVNRINDVAYEHSLVDRLLGCGTLVISDASEHGQVRLCDIPHVEQVHLQLSNLVFGADLQSQGRRRVDDGS